MKSTSEATGAGVAVRDRRGRKLPPRRRSPQSSSAPAPDWKRAREEHRHSAQSLPKFDIPMSTEPAFQFRA